MAYMNQEKKKELESGIKAVLKKYKMKGSLRIRHHMTLVCTLSAGELDIIGNANRVREINNNQYGPITSGRLDVNHHWIDSNYTGEVLSFLRELKDAMMKGNHNNSDIQTDYFDVGWYIDINVGGKNEYELTKGTTYVPGSAVEEEETA